ncbi:MAG TPA: response regulator [Pyrinomonadaceae bacterium]|nr:response regulator [Pyrinomonadaceae bacterium]
MFVSLIKNPPTLPHTILIVEDTEDTRFFMKFLLEHNGYLVLEAANGFEAIEVTKLKHPELILMDMSMPFMDGLTATRLIRALEVDGNVPIIAVTAHGKEYLKLALVAGCNELICKPVDFKILGPILSQYLPA